ncbi:putative death-receptor fusion protein-domain-containing protein [Amylocarpus encephaloides]|uniref:Death-receptor fusion protein-domain-containing protein n=1 Tax=Amylocarpus encephaloides TaxID=45428 RepID=A0A9P8C7X3_9HELO|nr:putative death-receptor fusion protein-domain-containing protein [Amylocarpus encephaloides]
MEVLQPPSDDRAFVKWLEGVSTELQQSIAEQKLQEFFHNASQPRHASGNACIKLCYFIEQCRSSASPIIWNIVFSRATSLSLFNFYVEWNEKNQNRSMRQVLELLSSLIAGNPDIAISRVVKDEVLLKIMPEITNEQVSPLVKPSFKSLECLLGKRAISADDLITAYQKHIFKDIKRSESLVQETSISVWTQFVSAIFFWLGPADVSPAAGKFLVTVFKRLKTNELGRTCSMALEKISLPDKGSGGNGSQTTHDTLKSEEEVGDDSHPSQSALWQQWIRQGLAKHPRALENVKNYLFSPLFKIDRLGSLAFLKDLNEQKEISELQNQDIDAQSMLQLAAMDAGKKAGLVEEPGIVQTKENQSKESVTPIILDEEAIGRLLSTSSDPVRSLAFSVLTTSFSSIRPLSPKVLDALLSNLGLLHSNTDAKFRNEILSNTKHLLERLRGATALLVRQLEQSLFKLSRMDGAEASSKVSEQAVRDATEALLFRHQQFLEQYADFLLGELVPTASYQRHVTALRAIKILLQTRLQQDGRSHTPAVGPSSSTVWPFTIQFFTPQSMRLLLDLLVDPFEDVRSSAMDILGLSSPANFTNMQLQGPDVSVQDAKLKYEHTALDAGPTPSVGELIPRVDSTSPRSFPLEEFILEVSEASRRTGRADYADGVARSYKILFTLQPSIESRLSLVRGMVDALEYRISIAEESLSRAVVEAPVHGDFAALSFVSEMVIPALELSAETHLECWEQWSKLESRMVSLASRIWNTVQAVLCDDSPEGRLLDNIDDNDTIDTKDILSYSFRAVHESSNLTKTLARTLKSPWPKQFAQETNKIFTKIGGLAFTQLSNLRHRGAFSTVSLTFSYCCQLTHHFSVSSSNESLLNAWWKGTLICIANQASTTRRSAGIPSLIIGVMSANARQPSSDEMMDHLIREARIPAVFSGASNLGELPQVHALNSIREVFGSSSVRHRSDRSVVECLALATDCFGSDVWPIRNCALLLFQRLTDFLLGSETRDNSGSMTSGDGLATTFSRYPGLWSLLMGLLEKSAAGDDPASASVVITVEKIFPVLEILRRAGSSHESMDFVRKNVLKHLGSKFWQVRDLAARTLCTLTPEEEWHSASERLLGLSKTAPSNVQHGALLAIKVVLQRRMEDGQPINEGLAKELCLLFLRHFASTIEANCPLPIFAARLDVGNEIMSLIMSAITQPSPCQNLSELLETVFVHDACAEMKQLLRHSGTSTDLSFLAVIRRAVYITAIKNDIKGLRHATQYALSKGTDAGLCAIQTAHKAWNKVTNYDAKIGLFHAYTLAASPPATPNAHWITPQVRAAAIRYIANLLDDMGGVAIGNLTEEIQKIAGHYGTGRSSPELTNAWCRFSGIATYASLVFKSGGSLMSLERSLCGWGGSLIQSLKDEQPFELRLAAVKALRSFYRRSSWKKYSGQDCLLPSLFGIYTALNDDEDDIRKIGAESMAAITNNYSAPPAAAEYLIEWLERKYAHSPTFAHNVLQRMMGSTTTLVYDSSASIPRRNAVLDIENSMVQDNSLFAQESSNLWLDPQNDARIWSKVFCDLPKDTLFPPNHSSPYDTPLGRAAGFSQEGLERFVHMIEDRRDGPAGWMSKPATFTVCARIICCSNAILAHLCTAYGMSLRESIHSHPLTASLSFIGIHLKRLIIQGQGDNVHQQLLLLLLGPSSLSMTKLDTLLPERIHNILGKFSYLRGSQARRL